MTVIDAVAGENRVGSDGMKLSLNHSHDWLAWTWMVTGYVRAVTPGFLEPPSQSDCMSVQSGKGLEQSFVRIGETRPYTTRQLDII